MCNFPTTLVIFGNKIFSVLLGSEQLHFYEVMYTLFQRWENHRNCSYSSEDPRYARQKLRKVFLWENEVHTRFSHKLKITEDLSSKMTSQKAQEYVSLS